MTIRAGEVTAVVGENGAGKSTLVKMLAGVESPDAGTIIINGSRVRFRSARDAALAGVGMVYQETALVPKMTVWENIALGWESSSLRGLDKQASVARLRRISAEFGLNVPEDALIEDLPVSVQQQVEIMKVLYREAKVVILDEPTGVLTPQEARGLFRAIRTLREAGKSVIFISHKLNEVLEISDQIFVMRAGEIVASTSPANMSPRDLAKLMLGGELPEVTRDSAPSAERPVVVDINEMVCARGGMARSVGPISMKVYGGTVLGVAGVAGSGQDEFIATLTGITPPVDGYAVFMGAERVRIRAGIPSQTLVRALRNAGLAYVPSDRGQVGTLATRPLWFSAIAGRQWLPEFTRNGFLRRRRVRDFARRILKEGAVRSDGIDVRPSALSGGNLQKFIVARELAFEPTLFVAEEPTRGIDIGSAVAIRQRVRDLAAAGCAVVVASSDLDELMEISDEVAVFFNGSLVTLMRRADATTESIGAAMTGLGTGEPE